MTAPARRGRVLLGTCVALAVAAALLWGASAAVWYRVTPTGRGAVAVDGGSVHPWLSGLALLALAGIAGLVAVAGVARRAVAAVLGLAGAATAVPALLDLFAVPFPAGAPASASPRLPAGVSVDSLRGAPTVTTAAPLLAVAAGVTLVAIAVFVLLREPQLARFGSRYAAPGARPAAVDPDRAAWAALDEGRDPTAHGSGAGRGSGADGSEAGRGSGADGSEAGRGSGADGSEAGRGSGADGSEAGRGVGADAPTGAADPDDGRRGGAV